MAPVASEDDYQPLINSNRNSLDDAVDDSPEANGHLWIWLLTISSCISGLLFGYDTASISAALLHLGLSLSTPDHAVTTWDKSLITSATSFGALAGALVAGVLADRIGRRGVIWVADVLFLVGALWQAFSNSVGPMVWGRIIVGLGVGSGSLIVPLYLSELAPPSHRGRLVVMSTLCVTVGQLVAYALGIVLSPPRLSRDLSWRYMIGLGAAPAVVQAILMIFMPETPRYLLMKNRPEAAAHAISLVYGTEAKDEISQILNPIESSISTRGKSFSLAEKTHQLFTVPGNIRALIIACFLQFLQQACGFNSLMYFSATIFQMVGFTNPTAVAMVVAGTNAAFSFIAFALVDRIGRRKMLIRSLTGMIIGLALCSMAFLALPPVVKPGEDSITAAEPAPPREPPSFAGIIIIVSIIIYVATYAMGMGPIPWLCQSEFFKLEVRGVGTGAATATNWLSNLLVAATFLGFMELIGGAATFGMYMAVCVGGLAVVWLIYPETAGMRIEDIEEVLKDGWGRT